METRYRKRETRKGLLEMSSEKKTDWILEAVDDIQKMEEELNVYRRKIFKLHNKIKELEDENQSLIVEAATDIKNLEDENQSLKAQLEMNQDVTQPGDDDVFIPRSYNGKKSNLKKTTTLPQTPPQTPPQTLPQTPPQTLPQTPPEIHDVFKRYKELNYRPPTPPRRKTGKGGKRGKNIKTMKKYSKK